MVYISELYNLPVNFEFEQSAKRAKNHQSFEYCPISLVNWCWNCKNSQFTSDSWQKFSLQNVENLNILVNCDSEFNNKIYQ